MRLTRKYAQSLIRRGQASREYRPLARCTAERNLDRLYAVLARPQLDGTTRYDHYLA